MVIIRKRGLGTRKQRTGGEVREKWAAGTALSTKGHQLQAKP